MSQRAQNYGCAVIQSAAAVEAIVSDSVTLVGTAPFWFSSNECH